MSTSGQGNNARLFRIPTAMPRLGPGRGRREGLHWLARCGAVAWRRSGRCCVQRPRSIICIDIRRFFVVLLPFGPWNFWWCCRFVMGLPACMQMHWPGKEERRDAHTGDATRWMQAMPAASPFVLCDPLGQPRIF